MKRTVRRHPEFLADVEGQVRWIERHRDATWIARLRAALDQAIEAIERFPTLGAAVTSPAEPAGSTAPLRKLILRRVPFVLWYRVRGEEVWILRLFHARQKRARRAAARRGKKRRPVVRPGRSAGRRRRTAPVVLRGRSVPVAARAPLAKRG